MRYYVEKNKNKFYVYDENELLDVFSTLEDLLENYPDTIDFQTYLFIFKGEFETLTLSDYLSQFADWDREVISESLSCLICDSEVDYILENKSRGCTIALCEKCYLRTGSLKS